MITAHELKNRDHYLRKLIGFKDTEPVKVITGIRRCGKSSLLRLMMRYLRDNGVSDEQIVEMNFESYAFLHMSADDVYQYVNSSHELKLMGFRLSGFQAALRQVPGDSSLLSLQPRLSGQFLPF